MELWPKVTEFLLTQGWAGVLVIGMVAVIWDQRKEITFLRQRNSVLQDSRVADVLGMTREMVDAITGTRAQVQALIEWVKERRE